VNAWRHIKAFNARQHIVFSMRFQTYNFRFAEEILYSQSDLKKEIKAVLDPLVIDPNAKGDNMPHRVIKAAFMEKGWSDEELLSTQSKMRFDLYKNRIAIEIETSNIVHCYKDYLKFLVGFNMQKIDVGVEIVYANDYIKKHNPKKHAKPTLERVRYDLEHLFRPIITVPIFVIGLED
jgi:hypothetical protein